MRERDWQTQTTNTMNVFTESENKHICIAFRKHGEWEQDVMMYLDSVAMVVRAFKVIKRQYKHLEQTSDPIFFSDLSRVEGVPITYHDDIADCPDVGCLDNDRPFCDICLSNSSSMAVTMCNHVFCTQCVINHMITDALNTCPTCNDPIMGEGAVVCLPYNATTRDVKFFTNPFL